MNSMYCPVSTWASPLPSNQTSLPKSGTDACGNDTLKTKTFTLPGSEGGASVRVSAKGISVVTAGVMTGVAHPSKSNELHIERKITLTFINSPIS
jgi:hypothetical protein